MREVTLSKTNRIVLPKDAREALGVKAGDRLVVVTRGAIVVVMAKPESHAKALAEMAYGTYEREYVKTERANWDN